MSTSGCWGREELEVPGAHLAPDVSPARAGLASGQLDAAYLGKIPKIPSPGLWLGVPGEGACLRLGAHPLGATFGPRQPQHSPQLLHNPVTSSSRISCEMGTHRALSLSPDCPWVAITHCRTRFWRWPPQAGHQPSCPQTKNHHIVVREGHGTGTEHQTRWEEDTAGDTKSLRDMSHIPMCPPCPLQPQHSPSRCQKFSTPSCYFKPPDKPSNSCSFPERFPECLWKDQHCSARTCPL